MKRTMRRTAGISWGRWHRMVVTRSLQMMVMSGVVRRADLNPPLVHLDFVRGRPDGQGGERIAAGVVAEPGWFVRMFFSRGYLLRHPYQQP
jgi:hypothetical protein